MYFDKNNMFTSQFLFRYKERYFVQLKPTTSQITIDRK